MRQAPRETATPLTRLVELPGRGVTPVWECAGPRDAQTLMLIHGLAATAELNWGKVFASLSRHFRVVAADLRSHGDGISAGSRFRLWAEQLLLWLPASFVFWLFLKLHMSAKLQAASPASPTGRPA